MKKKNVGLGFLGSTLDQGGRGIDSFDLHRLEYVLRICAECASISSAGRKLFSVSRQTKASVNDTDRLKKYLFRFGLEPKQVLGIASDEREA